MCAAFSPLQTCPAKKDSLFHRGHPGLQCAALAGPDGSAFLFLPALCPFCLNFHQREARCFSAGKDGYFVSEGFSRQLPLATAAHNRLTRLQQGRSGASLVSFPYLSSIPHTALHRPSYGFVSQNEVTPPPLGEGLGLLNLELFGFSRQLPLATAAHNRLTRLQRGGEPASLVSFPYPASKTAHRATQGRVWFHCFFLARFGVGRVDKSRSSL